MDDILVQPSTLAEGGPGVEAGGRGGGERAVLLFTIDEHLSSWGGTGGGAGEGWEQRGGESCWHN